MTPFEEIERDLDWREAEIAVLRIHLINDRLQDREKLVFFRAAWALLYAHYEGFCKFALTVYYEEVQRLGKKNAQLPARMQSVALDKKLRAFRSLPTIELIAQALQFNELFMDDQPSFPDVDTQSNLWPNVLKNLLDDADLTNEALANNNRSLATLVNRRNKIAHGERDIIPEFNYYRRFEKAVLSVMSDLALSIDDKLKAL